MGISRKLRFEVFKRDGFGCQYCGKTPPEVTLEVDHITPKSREGRDDINNLLTACFDCNRGKSNISLKKVPPTLHDRLKILHEKELQLKEYNNFIAKIEKRIHKDIDEIDEVFTEMFPEHCLTEEFKNTAIRQFVKLLPKIEIKEAMYLACNKLYTQRNRALKYFCGVCWRKIKKDYRGS